MDCLPARIFEVNEMGNNKLTWGKIPYYSFPHLMDFSNVHNFLIGALVHFLMILLKVPYVGHEIFVIYNFWDRQKPFSNFRGNTS